MPRPELLAAAAVAVVSATLAGAWAVAARPPPPGQTLGERLSAELAALDRSQQLVAEKVEARQRELRGRVRALYKLTRAGTLPLWVDEHARADLVKRRAVARRVILRDLAEHRKLLDELAGLERARARLATETRLLALATRPAPARRSLARPVPGPILERFGPYRDPATKIPLSRRGITLGSRPGAGVVAPADGRVVFAGPLRGLGTTVLLDHGDGLVSVLAHLAAAGATPGTSVTRGALVGTPAGDRVYLEVRLAGRPIDPESLVAPQGYRDSR